ncbi:ammonium transporter [Promicromonospora sukumoe]|uniref:Ammonium transporter n=1 Tax=Promicromonospora sukumoe TaxID=88382 RepID=A0A7W3J5S0_9MICO|nr:ammonium transporter [Promicromonospora sukumoe]MBA8806822.1 Amt family ammonium transporter [Promicromonospora sukumoe]
MEFELDTGNTAWLITASSLVLLMTPGLAFFYGGMVRGKSVLNMMMMSFASIGVAGLIWVVYGYGLAFGPDLGGFIGNPVSLIGLTIDNAASPVTGVGIPGLVFAGFQATFAIITVALISGAIADRVKFGTWIVFSAIWVTVVYAPLAHWVWGGGMFGADGWLASALSLPIDFAGGTVVHINAGAAALALALVIGKRKGFGTEAMRPHNLPFVMLGAALLWFGWFGFNAGSELAADGTAGRAWVNTLVTTGVAMLAWMVTEKFRDGAATSLGAASGVVAGLVAITPAAGTVDTWGAIVIGLVAGVLCSLAVGLKYKFGYDDSLDVVGVHLVGGLVGTILIGFFATNGRYDSFYFEGSLNGLFYGGGVTQLLTQIVAALVAVVYSFVLTYIIGLALKATMGWRVSEEAEVSGIDLAVHGETAYENSGSTITEVR